MTRIFVRPTVIGRENLSLTGAMIVASSHRSVFDPIALFGPIVKYRPDATFLAMAELFRYPVIGSILRWLGIIPVARGTDAAITASETGITVLKAGGVVAAFIEGKVSRTDELLPPKSGVAYMALATNAPVVPVAMVGTERVRRLGAAWWRWGWGRRYVIAIGKPIPVPREDVITKQVRDDFTTSVMAAIRHQVDVANGIHLS